MCKIIDGLPQLEPILGTRLKRLTCNYEAHSYYLGRLILILKGFVYDEESTPWRGENPLAGLIHDYLSRKDAIPAVTKWQASRVYLEFMEFEDSLIERKWWSKAHDWIWRNLKAGFVGVCPDFVYWHKLSVESKAEAIFSQVEE